MVPTASTRRQFGPVYLPEMANDSGASWGGAKEIACAGRYACPASVAGNCCWADTSSGRASATTNTVKSNHRLMGSLLKIGIPQMARDGVKNSNFLDCPEAKRGGADGVRQPASGVYLVELHLFPRDALRGVDEVRFGSKADICSARGHVRFTPQKRTFDATREMS